MNGKRWFFGFQKAYNSKVEVAHLMFPGFVVNETALLQWDAKKIANHVLVPLQEADVVIKNLREDKAFEERHKAK